ncbi:MAG: CHC2 zinc finger domain-containing protein [Actinomycetota bacterium]|nr:CHC2 zinc finger domain-containing protein [Actinomycetota bacterium]
MTASPIEAARRRHSLADVARRTGISLPGTTGAVTVRCPLASHGHPDRSPSLRLFLDAGIFFCFGCGARGDVVEWVCRLESLGWREAIAALDSGRPLANAWSGARSESARAGSAVGHPAAAAVNTTVGRFEAPDLSRTPPARVHEALQLAWEHCSRGHLHELGVTYLGRRCIDVPVLEALNDRAEVGHSPEGPQGLVQFMRGLGFDDDELVDAGLAQRRLGERDVVDFYRHRVLVPVRDGNGRIRGMIGRSVGGASGPKYKNPPRTHAYDKSVNLYRPLTALSHPHGRVVVVEGTLDAMAIAVAAIRSGLADRLCPVTQSGRELSERQIQHVLALSPAPPIVSFDGDAAGRDSNRRLALSFAGAGRRPIVASLPDGHDPASLLAEHGDGALATWLTTRTHGEESAPAVAGSSGQRGTRAGSAESGPAGISVGGLEL